MGICSHSPDMQNAELHRNITTCKPMKNPIYPINTLRRLAINNILTTHFVNLDMDLWPSCNDSFSFSHSVQLYEGLQQIDAATANLDRVAFVLPAFQFTTKVREICKTTPNCFEQLKKDLPSNKAELLNCMHREVCQIANARLPTHVMANSMSYIQRFVDLAWWTEKQPVQRLPCIPYAIMEPYVVMQRTPHSPMYNENFINYGYNKVQFIDELEHRGYVFAVLTVGFGFDIPHKP